MADFFVSYNKNDLRWAEWIAWQLEASGYKTVIQAWDFRPGANFALKMDKALRQSKRLIVVLSKSYLAGPYSASEWAAAFHEDPTGEHGKIVPVKVDGCKPQGLLASISYIDLSRVKNKDKAKTILLEGVRQQRGKPTVQPVYPADDELGPEPDYPGRVVRSISKEPGYPGAVKAIKDIVSDNSLMDSDKDAMSTMMLCAMIDQRIAALLSQVTGNQYYDRQIFDEINVLTGRRKELSARVNKLVYSTPRNYR
jgi:hypothetical protein